MIYRVTVEISVHEEILEQIIPGEPIKLDPAAGELNYPGYRRQSIEVLCVNGRGEIFGPGGKPIRFPSSTRSRNEFDLINPHHYKAWRNGRVICAARLREPGPFQLWGGDGIVFAPQASSHPYGQRLL